jgi:hypothetical protein
MRWISMASVGAVVVALIIYAVAPGALTAEEEIRRVLKEGVERLEARDLKGAVALLAEDYQDGGGRTRDNLKGIAFVIFQRGPVLVHLSDVRITLQDDATATAELKAIALQGAEAVQTARDLLPTRGRALELTVKLHKRSGKWLVSAIDGDNLASFGL